MSSVAPVRIACLQEVGTPGDVTANLASLAAAAIRARAAGAQLLITSEMFVTGYDCGAIDTFAERSTAIIDEIQAIARSNGLALLVGMPVPLSGGGTGNCAVFVDENGTTLARRTKSHLYGSIDRTRFTEGNEPVTLVDFHGVRIAILICYEIEFPENARMAALAGADLILVPTANMSPYEEINEHLIWTRAWENQLFVAYINHCGDERSTHYVGLSSIIGPDGTRLALAGTEPALLVADIDPQLITHVRSGFGYLADRRPSLYASLTERTPHQESESL